MQSPLQELADVSTGLTLRGPDSSRKTAQGGLHLLRISDITEDGRVQIDSPNLLDPALADVPRYRVAPGDLLVPNRGMRQTAAIVPNGLEATAGGQLFIVRPNASRVSTEFLHWYLNLPSTQDSLRSQARGTNVLTLSISVLRSLPIPVPPPAIQARLCELADLAARERALIQAIAAKREQLLQSAYHQTLLRFTA